jgi:hypothetical protein
VEKPLLLPSVLAQICAIIGVALLPLSLGALRYYKDKVDEVVSDQISEILGGKKISDFIKKIKERKLTFRMVSDFYKEFHKANFPARLLRGIFRELLMSGVFFISTAIAVGVDNAFFEFLSYQTLAMGFALLVMSMIDFFRLEKIV